MSIVKYDGPMDPIETPFDLPHQVLYLYHLELTGIRSRAAKNAGVKLYQVNALRARNIDFAHMEAAALEASAEDMISSTRVLAEQGDVKAFDLLMTKYYMAGQFNQNQTAGVINNTQINLTVETGEVGVREQLERLRQTVLERATELESPSS